MRDRLTRAAYIHLFIYHSNTLPQQKRLKPPQPAPAEKLAKMSSTPPVPTSGKPRSADRSPYLAPKPLTSTTKEDGQPPVDPSDLANAMKNLNTLQSVKTPAGSAAPSAATSPDVSGSNSPNPPGQLQLEGLDKLIQQNPLAMPAGEGKLEGKTISVPGTPHFGAQSEL